MTASAVNLRSVRLDQRRVAALLGASRQVPVPPFNYPKVTIDNLFKSRFYRDLEKRGEGDASESQKRLKIQSKHLQSHYNLRKNVEKSVSKKIEAIRNRAEDVEAYSENEDGKRRETRHKQKRRGTVDNDQKETWSKLKGRRNSKTNTEEGFEGKSKKLWSWNNLSRFKANSNVSLAGSQLFETYHDNSKESQLSTELQLSDEGQNKHLNDSTPFRLPKLQIPDRRQEKRGTSVKLKQPETDCLPRLPSTSATQSQRKETLQQSMEFSAPYGEDFASSEPTGGGKYVQTSSHFESKRKTKRQSNEGRRQKTKETSSPESYQNSDSQSIWLTKGGDSQETRPKSIERKIKSDDLVVSATDEDYLKVSELSLRPGSETVNQGSSDEYDGMSTDDEHPNRLQSQEYKNPTIRKKTQSRGKWDPNSHSEFMRRKLNTLIRKRRQARLDKIRLGQSYETDQMIDTSTYIDSERTVPVLYENAPEYGKTRNLMKHSKTKKRGRRKNRVTSKTTSRAFSYSYFA